MSGRRGGREIEVTRALERWFDRRARDLPWRRGERTGYTGLVSEAMLQQTQVARVVGWYEAFMARFPTIGDLAEAEEQEVLALWQGMGYYRRARHLHAAAKMVVDEHGGEVPCSVDALRRLPGVGPYSAGAIASMVFGAAEPLVDGNVRRVLARWHPRRYGAAAPGDDKWAWRTAREYVRRAARPGVFNEALMELGATICTPGRSTGAMPKKSGGSGSGHGEASGPRCDVCPVQVHCEARRRGIQGKVPAPRKAAERPTLYCHAVIVRRGAKILLEQRGEHGLWSAMWQPPTVEAPQKLEGRAIRRTLGVAIDRLRRRVTFEHQTTHRRLVFQVYESTSRARRGVWRSPDDLDDLPMSTAHRRAIDRVVSR